MAAKNPPKLKYKEPVGSSAVVLLTSKTEGVRDCGSGFCVRTVGADSFVVTCAHVVRELDPGTGEVLVNGLSARVISSGDESGVDLSVVLVPGHVLPPVEVDINRSPIVGDAVSGHGYFQLHQEHYASNAFNGKVDRLLIVRQQTALLGAVSFRIESNNSFEFAPGNSGSPICDSAGRVIGVLAFASREGKYGYALACSSLPTLLPALLPGASVKKATGLSSDSRVSAPPALGDVIDDMDIQRGRFGGRSNDGKVTLSVGSVRTVGTSYFTFSATVRSVARKVKVLGPARFFLHDSYPRSIIEIRKLNSDGSLTLRDVHSYGIFTLGCQVYCSDGWHSVEVDLKVLGDSDKLPTVFLNR